MLKAILAKVRKYAAALLRGQPQDMDEMERDLRDLLAEQKKLAKAVAISDDIPELVSTMTRNQLRVKLIEEQISTAKRAPDQLATMMARIERTGRERMTKLRDAITKPEELREVFLACVPLGLPLSPGRDGGRAIWEVNGLAEFPLLSERDSCLLSRDPNAESLLRILKIPVNVVVLDGHPGPRPRTSDQVGKLLPFTPRRR